MNTTSVRPHSLWAALLASAAISRYMSRSRSRLGSSAAMSTSTSVSSSELWRCHLCYCVAPATARTSLRCSTE